MSAACQELEVATDNKFIGNDFQTYVATLIVSQPLVLTVAHLPTGAGKTYIAALVAFYYKKKDNRVAIVTTGKFLVNQLRKMLGKAKHDVDILSMKDALCRNENYDVLIFDEADACVLEHGSVENVNKSAVVGFWDMFAKRAVLLTATVSTDFADVLNALFEYKESAILKFAEIYDAVPGACKQTVEFKVVTEDAWLDEMAATIAEKGHEKPVIVFLENKAKLNVLERRLKQESIPVMAAPDDLTLETVIAVIRQ